MKPLRWAEPAAPLFFRCPRNQEIQELKPTDLCVGGFCGNEEHHSNHPITFSCSYCGEDHRIT